MSHFHPLVARWFADTLGEPTPGQRQGWQAGDRIRPRHADCGADRVGQDAGSLPDSAGWSVSGRAARPLARRSPGRLRVTAQGAERRHPQESRAAAARHRPARGSRRARNPPRITAAVRTGDTSQSERAAMLRTPPHILVTTPESLFLLLTAERSRRMLRTVRTVIVDEIHAVIGTRRGAHLALSLLERLQEVAATPLLRIGLSATQTPVETVAAFLVGDPVRGADMTVPAGGCAIVDEGHRRALDLALELPRSSLEAVMSGEIWEEYTTASPKWCARTARPWCSSMPLRRLASGI